MMERQRGCREGVGQWELWGQPCKQDCWREWGVGAPQCQAGVLRRASGPCCLLRCQQLVLSLGVETTLLGSGEWAKLAAAWLAKVTVTCPRWHRSSSMRLPKMQSSACQHLLENLLSTAAPCKRDDCWFNVSFWKDLPFFLSHKVHYG